MQREQQWEWDGTWGAREAVGKMHRKRWEGGGREGTQRRRGSGGMIERWKEGERYFEWRGK